MPPKTERFELRLDEDILSRVDKWRTQQDDLPTRAEAMRRLVETGLERTSTNVIRLDSRDKLMLAMLSDISSHLKTNGNVNSGLVASALFGGHYWALEMEMSMLFHGHEDSRQNVSFVIDVLDMWTFIESAYRKLSKTDKAVIEQAVAPFGKSVQFPGFDGNNETELFGIARVLIEELGRFSGFKGRDLDCHFPVTATYRKMLQIFQPIRKTLVDGVELGATQIIELLEVRRAKQQKSQ